SLFYGLWRRRDWLHVLCLILASFSFVLLGNVIRIASGVVLKYHYQIDILTGWKHETVGLVIFAAALALVLNFDQLLVQLFAPIPSRRAKSRNASVLLAADAALKGREFFAMMHK